MNDVERLDNALGSILADASYHLRSADGKVIRANDDGVQYDQSAGSVEPALPVVAEKVPAEGLPPAMILPAPALGQLGGEAVIKYCEAAAIYIEQVRDKIMNDAISEAKSCDLLAANIREMAKLEA